MESATSIWIVAAPAKWPSAPPSMSFSALVDIEACPRRWALGAADYPTIWPKRGYPRPLQTAAIEGSVVHAALETITSEFVKTGCTSLDDERAVTTLRSLGGFSAIVAKSIDHVLEPYQSNPRAVNVLDEARHALAAAVPHLRSRVQRLLSRLRVEPNESPREIPSGLSVGTERRALSNGSHTEVLLKSTDIGWHGIADLLTITPTQCEIRDFKTGERKPEHELQLQIYSLLWAKDSDLNPTGRLVNRLVVSYQDGDSQVVPPQADALKELEGRLRSRTATAVNELQTAPPAARPSVENCTYCSVRHLCDDYWTRRPASGKPERSGCFEDLEITITSRHGPSSWDGIVKSSSILKQGTQVLLRMSRSDYKFQEKQTCRILNVHLSNEGKEVMSDDSGPLSVATTMRSSEVFWLQNPSLAKL